MTESDIDKIIPILLQVDGGCPACVKSVMRDFIEAFPKMKAKCEEALVKSAWWCEDDIW